MLTDRARLSLATRLAQTHGSGSLIFWTAEDWPTAQAVHCRRKDEERVVVQVRPVGRASLDPATTSS